MDQFSDHILIKSEGRFTTSTDLSIRQKQVITTTNVHKKAPRMSIWLWGSNGVLWCSLIQVQFKLKLLYLMMMEPPRGLEPRTA